VIKTVDPHNYKDDPLYRRVANAVRHLQQTKGDVCPIGIFLTMGLLTPEDLKAWQAGRVPFLELVLKCNLSKANRILRILRLHALDLDMRHTPIDYSRSANGRRIPLHFTRSGDPNIERAYARLFLPTQRTPAAEKTTRHA
jgi:hypothetical protein